MDSLVQRLRSPKTRHRNSSSVFTTSTVGGDSSCGSTKPCGSRHAMNGLTDAPAIAFDAASSSGASDGGGGDYALKSSDMILNMRNIDINSNNDVEMSGDGRTAGQPLMATSQQNSGFLARIRQTFGSSRMGANESKHAVTHKRPTSTKCESVAILSAAGGSVTHKLCQATTGYGSINGTLPPPHDDNRNDDDDSCCDDDDDDTESELSELDCSNWEPESLSDILRNMSDDDDDESDDALEISDTEEASGSAVGGVGSASSAHVIVTSPTGDDAHVCSVVPKPKFLKRVMNYFFSSVGGSALATPANTPRATPADTPLHSHHASTQEMHSRLEHYANR